MKPDAPPAVPEQPAAPAAACVACFSPTVFFGARKGYRYHRCTRCGTLQITPLPNKEELDEAYAKLYASANHISGDAEFYTTVWSAYFDHMLGLIRAYCASGRITEIGAGWGVLAEKLIRAGYAYEGIDLNRDMCEHCISRGLPVKQGGIEQLEGRQRDLIVMAQVFEHLVQHDQWLDKLETLLPRGAIFITAQPTAPFPLFFGTLFRLGIRSLPLPQLHVILTPPWHTVLFSIEGMRILLARHGFELIDIQPAPQQRDKGLNGLLQRILQMVNRGGWKIAATKWPLVTGHICVFRKTAEQESD